MWSKRICTISCFCLIITLFSGCSDTKQPEKSNNTTNTVITSEEASNELSNKEIYIQETGSQKPHNYESENQESENQESLTQTLDEQYPESQTNITQSKSMEESDSSEDGTIELIMVGDMLMHTKVMEKGLLSDGSYDFDYLFSHVQDKVESADLALVNQETILGGTELGLSGYPRFNSPYEVGAAEVEAGFDVILHATNHALDKGKTGLINCMNFWEEQYPEIFYLGINDTQEQQDENIYLYTKGDLTIAILNYTYSTNGIAVPEDMPFAVNYLNEKQVREDIAKAREKADFVIVCPHWGTEYQLEASKYQKKWAKIFFECGVDLVIGTHPHVIEPVEWFSDESGNKMLVYYSLGNFVNGTSGKGTGVANRMVGGMADVIIEKDENGIASIKDYQVIPLVCHWTDNEITTYYLADYTQEMAGENLILSQDPAFSLEYCENLVNEVWGEE